MEVKSIVTIKNQQVNNKLVQIEIQMRKKVIKTIIIRIGGIIYSILDQDWNTQLM
jgi:hypothetical protein